MKTCSKCKQEKGPNDFHRDKKRIDGLFPQCKECRTGSKTGRKRQEPSPIVVLEDDERLAVNRAWADKNRDKINQEAKARYHADPEPYKERVKGYRGKNPEKFRQFYSRWNNARRSRLHSVEYDGWTRTEILERDGCVCAYCGVTGDPSEFHIDHIFPISRGGLNTRDNLAVACVSCNTSKSSRTLDEWFSKTLTESENQ